MAEASFVSEGKLDGMEGLPSPPSFLRKPKGEGRGTKTASAVTQFDDERWMRDRQNGEREKEEGREKKGPLHRRPQFLIFTLRPPHFPGEESYASKSNTFLFLHRMGARD